MDTLVVTDQQIFGLLKVLQQHPVIFAAKIRRLIAAEGRMRRIGVISDCPHAARLDFTTNSVSGDPIARPDTDVETVDRVISIVPGHLIRIKANGDAGTHKVVIIWPIGLCIHKRGESL